MDPAAKIVALTSGGPHSWIMINALQERFGRFPVLLEDGEPQSKLWRRRRKMLGLLKVASIVAATIVFWQFAVVPQLPGTGGFVPASVTAEGPALRLAFAGDAPLSEITAILQQANATFTDGPGALGLYTVSFPTEAEREAAEDLFAERPELVTMISRP